MIDPISSARDIVQRLYSDLEGDGKTFQESDLLATFSPAVIKKTFSNDPEGYLNFLREKAGEIKQCLDSLRKLSQENLVDIAESRRIVAEKCDRLIEKTTHVSGTLVEAAYIWVAFPLHEIIGEFLNIGDVGRSLVQTIFVSEFIFRFMDRIGRGAGLIYRKEALNALRLRLKVYLKDRDLTAEESKKVAMLRSLIEEEEKKLSEEGCNYLLHNIEWLPTELNTIFIMLGEHSTALSYAMSWSFFLAGTLALGYSTYRAYGDVKSYEKAIGIAFNARDRRLKTSPETYEDCQKALNKIMNVRKGYAEEIKKKWAFKFELFLKAELAHARNNQVDFALFREGLIARAGLDLDHYQITDFEKLRGVIKEKGALYNNLLRQYADFKEVARVAQTRAALRSLAEFKAAQVSEHYRYTLKKSAHVLTLSTLVFAITLFLKTVALVGAASLTALAATSGSIGFFILGTALLIIGLYVLFRYKPTLAKIFAKGVQLRLALVSIPTFIKRFKLVLKDRKILEEILKIRELSSKLVELHSRDEDNLRVKDKQDRTRLRNCGIRIDKNGSYNRDEAIKKIESGVREAMERGQKLAEELETLNKSIEVWEKKAEPLKKILKEAKFRDFQISARLIENRHGKEFDFHEVIADSLMVGGSSLDKYTVSVLEKNLGIDWEKIPHNKEDVMDYLKTFFALDEKETKELFEKISERGAEA